VAPKWKQAAQNTQQRKANAEQTAWRKRATSVHDRHKNDTSKFDPTVDSRTWSVDETGVFRTDEGRIITSPTLRPKPEPTKSREFIMHYPVMTAGCIFNLIQAMEGRWNGTAHLHLYMGGNAELPKVASTELGFSHERGCWWMREQLTSTAGVAESTVSLPTLALEMPFAFVLETVLILEVTVTIMRLILCR
jgi:hypothetical protein